MFKCSKEFYYNRKTYKKGADVSELPVPILKAMIDTGAIVEVKITRKLKPEPVKKKKETTPKPQVEEKEEKED